MFQGTAWLLLFSSNFFEQDYTKCHSDDVDVDLMDHHVKNSLYCVGAMFDIYFFWLVCNDWILFVGISFFQIIGNKASDEWYMVD